MNQPSFLDKNICNFEGYFTWMTTAKKKIMTGDFENHFSALQKTQGMSFASEKTEE